jgi:hypothetical protein
MPSSLIQYLSQLLSEKSHALGLRASKIARFGTTEIESGQPLDNLSRLEASKVDIMTVYILLARAMDIFDKHVSIDHDVFVDNQRNLLDDAELSVKCQQLSPDTFQALKAISDWSHLAFDIDEMSQPLSTNALSQLRQTVSTLSPLPTETPHVPNIDGFELLIEGDKISVVSYAHCDDINPYSMTEPRCMATLEKRLVHYHNHGEDDYLFSDCDQEEPSTDVYVVALGTPDAPIFDVVRDDADLLSTYTKRFKARDGVFDICKVVIEDGLF